MKSKASAVTGDSAPHHTPFPTKPQGAAFLYMPLSTSGVRALRDHSDSASQI